MSLTQAQRTILRVFRQNRDRGLSIKELSQKLPQHSLYTIRTAANRLKSLGYLSESKELKTYVREVAVFKSNEATN